MVMTRSQHQQKLFTLVHVTSHSTHIPIFLFHSAQRHSVTTVPPDLGRSKILNNRFSKCNQILWLYQSREPQNTLSLVSYFKNDPPHCIATTASMQLRAAHTTNKQTQRLSHVRAYLHPMTSLLNVENYTCMSDIRDDSTGELGPLGPGLYSKSAL